jgi:CubicO group peptidase (beta-lactamase class C family)
MTTPITLADWQETDNSAWSYRHIRELVPTTRISRAELPLALAEAPAQLTDLAVAKLVADPSTDGVIVVHAGSVVFEQYRRGMSADDVHLLQSVSKSITGTLAGILVGKGQLDPEAAVTNYIPELDGSSFDGATVRQLLDMRAGTKFDETYSNPDSDLRHSEAQFGWAPGPRPQASSIAYLATLHNHRDHGGQFEYRSILTDVLGLVLERAAETRLGELIGRELWAPLGAEHDASVTVAADGFAVADGGISVTLRDLARFGLLLLNDGAGPYGQVVPATWISDTLLGGADSAEAFAADPEHREMLPGGHYRNQWWVPAGGQTLIALGIHGQFLYVDRATGMVCARLSTWPTSLDEERSKQTLAAFMTTAEQLAA